MQDTGSMWISKTYSNSIQHFNKVCYTDNNKIQENIEQLE